MAVEEAFTHAEAAKTVLKTQEDVVACQFAVCTEAGIKPRSAKGHKVANLLFVLAGIEKPQNGFEAWLNDTLRKLGLQ